MSVTINGSTGVTTPGISNSEGYTGDGLSIAAGAPAGAVTVDSSGNVGIGTSSPNQKLNVSGAITSTGEITAHLTDSASISYDGSGNFSLRAYGATAGTGFMTFATGGGGNSAGTERMRIDSSGKLLVGTTEVFDAQIISRTAGNSYNMYYQAPAMYSGTYRFIRFQAGSPLITVGSIESNGATTTYSTTSDYRLKENIQPMQGALATVALLNPVTYSWKADGSAGQGFIAHELQAVVPDCVTGEKDAVDAEGKPQYQGMDTSFLVATLTAALQELNTKVEAQAAEIAALKGAAQ